MSTRSRLARFADRCTGYLALFLIGLIGWYYDRFGSPTPPRERALRRAESGIRTVGRFVD